MKKRPSKDDVLKLKARRVSGPTHRITRAEALKLEARRLRTIAEDLERMAAAAEVKDFGYESIARYPKI